MRDHPLNPMKGDPTDTFYCPKATHVGRPDQAQWRKEDGWRTCTYCGSLHPDDMIEAVRKAIRTGGKEMHISTGKPGKHYVRGKTDDGKSRNGKFYGDHMPKEKRNDPTLADELGRAVSISWNATFAEPNAVDQLGELLKDDDGP